MEDKVKVLKYYFQKKNNCGQILYFFNFLDECAGWQAETE